MSSMENQHGAYGSFGSANDADLVKKVNAFNESKIEHGGEEPSSPEGKAAKPGLGTSAGDGEDVHEAGKKVSDKVGDMLNRNK